jgi:NAD(P)-dependent dehydrogenase (short-subunit alcohol dehydrogenase family)
MSPESMSERKTTAPIELLLFPALKWLSHRKEFVKDVKGDMDLALNGRVAVVTGGSEGIGLAVAQGLAKEGVHVALCARNEDRVVEEARRLKAEYRVNALGLPCDVTVPADIERLAHAVERELGGADILINNAGAGSRETIMTAPDDRWQHYWDLHVMAAVRFARAFVPQMRRRGGGVVLTNASICATQPLDYEPIYNVTKAALVMLSKCLAGEVIGDNIRVNCINPGLVLTRAWEEYARDATAASGGDWKGHLEQIARTNAPIGRFASVEELADFFVFLCSPRASYCVGSTYYVDGGWLRVVT